MAPEHRPCLGVILMSNTAPAPEAIENLPLAVLIPAVAEPTGPRHVDTYPFPESGRFMAWRPLHKEWMAAERVFAHMGVGLKTVINMSSGKIWDTEWWMPNLPDPEATS